jgi:hypothetical protein
MKTIFSIAIVFYGILNAANAQEIYVGNLTTVSQQKQANALAAYEIQLINKSTNEISFKYSVDKIRWHTSKLKLNDYQLVSLNETQSYYYIKLCSNVAINESDNCPIYRLKRQTRNKFVWDPRINAYTIKSLN